MHAYVLITAFTYYLLYWSIDINITVSPFPATPGQDRKPLTGEPLHDSNSADQAQDIMDKGEDVNTMDDILEASCG